MEFSVEYLITKIFDSYSPTIDRFMKTLRSNTNLCKMDILCPIYSNTNSEMTHLHKISWLIISFICIVFYIYNNYVY